MDIMNWVASNVLGMKDEPMLCTKELVHYPQREVVRMREMYTIPAKDVYETVCRPTGEVCDVLLVPTVKCIGDDIKADCDRVVETRVECLKLDHGSWMQQVKRWQEEFQFEVVRQPATVKD